MDKVLVYGASGHGKVIVDILEQSQSYSVISYVDDNEKITGTDYFGYPVILGRDNLLSGKNNCRNIIVAIGDNHIRMELSNWLLGHNYGLVNAIHPSTCLARDVDIGVGNAIMAGAVVNSSTSIGSHVIINTNASIDHDCSIGSGVHIAPGATLCGGVVIGESTLIGAGATLIPGIKVGRNCIIGAGSTVIESVPDNAKVYGNPAR